MAKWKVQIKGYDYDDINMVKGGLIRAGLEYINDINTENEELKNRLYYVDFEYPRDSYNMHNYKMEINMVTNKYLTNNKLMREYIVEKEEEILSLFEMINENNENSSRLAEFYLYSITLERRVKKLIRLISYVPTNEKGYLKLYHNLYYEIKRSLEWYYAEDKTKVVKWKFYTNKECIGKHLNFLETKFNFIPIDTTDKPIRNASALITELITNKKPDTKKSIPQNKNHFIL